MPFYVKLLICLPLEDQLVCENYTCTERPFSARFRPCPFLDFMNRQLSIIKQILVFADKYIIFSGYKSDQTPE